MRITVLGAGTWGIALAILLAENKHEVTIWSKLPSEIRNLSESRSMIKNLPGAVISEDISLTVDLDVALKSPEIIIMAVSSTYVREIAKCIASKVPHGILIVNVAKGIEEGTLKLLSEVIEDEIPHAEVAVLSGPSHAEEVSRKIPTSIVAGAKKKDIARKVQDVFMNNFFRVYICPDIVGMELGASLKNVIALAAGIVDGMGLGDNTKAALMTRGIAEISRLGDAMGAKHETFAGLSGIGDLIVTCTSKHSRNRHAGYLIGQGELPEKAIEEVGQVVEGFISAKAAYDLGQKYAVELPIVEQINNVLFKGKSVSDAIYELLSREKTEEYTVTFWEK